MNNNTSYTIPLSRENAVRVAALAEQANGEFKNVLGALAELFNRGTHVEIEEMYYLCEVAGVQCAYDEESDEYLVGCDRLTADAHELNSLDKALLMIATTVGGLEVIPMDWWTTVFNDGWDPQAFIAALRILCADAVLESDFNHLVCGLYAGQHVTTEYIDITDYLLPENFRDEDGQTPLSQLCDRMDLAIPEGIREVTLYVKGDTMCDLSKALVAVEKVCQNRYIGLSLMCYDKDRGGYSEVLMASYDTCCYCGKHYEVHEGSTHCPYCGKEI